MRLLKKALCLLFAMLLCTISVAFANYTAQIKTTAANRMAYITGSSADLARKEITLLVKNTNGGIGYIKQTTADDNGAYSFNVPLENTELTSETVLISAQGADVTTTISEVTEFSQMYQIDLDAKLKLAGNSLSIQLDVDNIYRDVNSFIVLSIFYGKNNQLVDIKMNPIEIDGEDYSDEIVIEDYDSRAEYVKVFCWKTLASLVPLTESKTINDTSTLYLISDSLCMDYTGVPNYYPQTGWGQMIGDYTTNGLKVVNLARGGYSLKDLKDRKLPYAPEKDSKWDILMNNIEAGDYVIISSMINDATRNLLIYQDSNGTLYKWIGRNDATGKQKFAKSNGSGSFSTSADNVFEYGWNDLTLAYDSNAYPYYDATTNTYKTRLADMIDEVVEKGAVPIVVGSTHMDCPIEDANSSEKNVYTLKNVAKEVAEDKNILFIDMYDIANKHYEDLGGSEVAMDKYALTAASLEYYKNLGGHDINDFTTKTNDWVHYNVEGARMVANTIAYIIKNSDSGLANFVEDDIQPYISNIEEILSELN